MPITNYEIDYPKLTWYEKAMYWLLRLIEWIYELIYYHFMPYLAMFYSFFLINTKPNV